MKYIVLTALTTAIALSTPAFAADEINVSNGISAAGAPLAAHGVDLVALVNDGNPVEGFATHSATYDGASYYFTTAANREAFEANPAAYLPQHGGFCSFGVSVGKKFDGDPDQYLVADGKLYLFLNAETRAAFLKDVAGTAKTADDQWANIKSVAVDEL
ncbi:MULTISPECIES: YHS domain-containing (seleno)protein [unclassified Ruegeria]|uniref:YHS domain-containing (seleno)protein n=1 Tax=unclassified Ruegeria TaxID=2625375 RepID=UPI001489B376|nr:MULTISPECIES: YHS domain-containing (seleno)protein [unclassified Ruegeria]NOD77190.1 YHS domain-containing protein [Ruegeria sp. HKCCD4332]NOD89661.1 YHS domain-containing protein [Ruegeria sp. HKCCD4318]NOE13984.1 YHS domain-containing protein [Ruegeria sp. HKCCD4318-2]NOG08079.1 YHS domain-containing protein [Ruegeria sp. HKCCD4315]